MAKVGFYLRGARGKLAGAVFQRGADGATVAREIVKPKNPKTNGQMAQRMIFATATAAYSGLKAICDHSWEGVQYGSKSQQVFMKNALAMLRQRAADNEGNFLAKGVNVLLPNPYQVSRGSLSSLQNVTYDTNGAFKMNITPETVGGKEVFTVQNICNTLGIDKGDQITVIFDVFKDDPDAALSIVDNYAFLLHKLQYVRMTVKADAKNDDVFFNCSEDQFGSAVIVENPYGITITFDSAFEVYPNDYDTAAVAAIRSKKSGDQWLRSNETMHVIDGGKARFLSMLSTWFGNTTTINFESPYILNNAEPGSPAPVSTLIGATVKATTATTPEATKIVPNVAMINGGKYTGCALVKFSSGGTKVSLYEFINTNTVKETTAEYLANSLSSYLIDLNEAEQVLNYQLTVQPAS